MRRLANAMDDGLHGRAQYRRTILIGLGLGIALWALASIVGWLVSGALERLEPGAGAVGGLGFFLLLGVLLQWLLGARRRNAGRLRQLVRAVEQSPSTVLITDLKGNIEYVNPKFTELTGYSLKEARGQNPRILKSGHTPPEVYAEMWRTISGGGEWRGEFQNVKKNGELYWESASLSSIRDATGKVAHYLAVKEDITARKAAEAAEHDQRRLAEALRDTAAVLNSSLDVRTVLDQILANVGRVVPHDMALVLLMDDDRRRARVVRSRDSAGQPWAAPGAWDAVAVAEMAALRWVMEHRFSHIISDTHADPEWLAAPGTEWIRSQAVMPISREDDVVGFLVLSSATPEFFGPEAAERLQGFADQVAVALRNAALFDALQQHAVELEQRVAERTAALRQGRSQLRAILDGMGEGVIYMEDRRVVYTNRALLAMFGFEDHAAPHDALLAAMQQREDFDLLLAEMQHHFEGEAIWRKQLKVSSTNGREVAIVLTAAPVPGGEPDKPPGVVLIVRDVSQQEALEAQKERFLTHAAHELRTPITNLKMRLYLAQSQADRREAHLEVMGRAVNTLTDLVEDLLDMLRLERNLELRREAVELGQIVRSAVALQQDAAAAHDVALSADLPDTPLCVYGDPGRLAQAVDRLLINAIHQTPSGGQVRVSLASDTTDAAHQAVLRITDNGKPIAPHDLSQVFEPFFNASQGSGVGMGLGLSIAREIVRLHEGDLIFERCDEQTNVFTLRLELQASPCR